MKTKIIFLITIALTISFNTVFAQGCEDDTPLPSTDGKPSSASIKVFGYIQPQYNVYFTDPGENTFNFKRARVGVRGRVNRSFSYYVVLETSAFIGGGDAYLLDAFVSYDKHEWAKISLGSFKQPFSRELVTACHSLTTIDRSIVVDQLVSPQRDMGLMVLGGSTKTKFRYSAALMNGRGLGVNDNNQKKDIITRATYQAWDFLNIGGSIRYGYPNNNEDSRTTYGLDALITYKGWALQGEYIYDEGDYNRAAGGGCGAEPLPLGEKRKGAYGMLTYDVTEKFQPVFKYEFFDADTSIKTLGYQEMMTFGINYFFHKNVRLQINYQAKKIDGSTKNNDALLTQVQVKF